MNTRQSTNTELFVPRVLTVAFAARHERKRRDGSFALIIRANIQNALNAGNYNPNLPRVRQVLGY